MVFHATMVDRITSQRQGTELDIPRAEPLPSKALVIEDLKGVGRRRGADEEGGPRSSRVTTDSWLAGWLAWGR